jgi:hypothetical protein
MGGGGGRKKRSVVVVLGSVGGEGRGKGEGLGWGLGAGNFGLAALGWRHLWLSQGCPAAGDLQDCSSEVEVEQCQHSQVHK